MSDENLNLTEKEELERLRAEMAEIKKGRNVGISFRVSEKGAVSVYGLGRFPVTLYKEQWERLLAASDQLKSFIAENAEKLKVR